MRDSGQLFYCLLGPGDILTLKRVFELIELILDFFFLFAGYLISKFLQGFFRGIHQGVRLIFNLHLFLLFGVISGKFIRVFDHFFYFFFRELFRRGNADRLFFTCP